MKRLFPLLSLLAALLLLPDLKRIRLRHGADFLGQHPGLPRRYRDFAIKIQVRRQKDGGFPSVFHGQGEDSAVFAAELLRGEGHALGGLMASGHQLCALQDVVRRLRLPAGGEEEKGGQEAS